MLTGFHERTLWLLAAATLLSACDGPSRGSVVPTLPETTTSAVFDSIRGVTVRFESPPGSSTTFTEEYGGAGWIPRAATGPTPREGCSMVFDSLRGEAVLYGGFQGVGVVNGETWGWDGAAWRLSNTAGPSPRYGMSMAFDSSRGVTVLYGGNTQTPANQVQRSNETWEWNGSSWMLRAAASPPALSRHAMCFDSSRNVTVLFGGFSGKRLPETWEWNGFSWSNRSTATRPSGRSLHAMAFDSARGVTVLFGGHDDEFDNETWEYDGVDWTRVDATGPASRVGHCMAFDSTRGVVVLSGGFNGSRLDDTWEWDGAQWTRRASLASGAPFSARLYFYEF